MLEIFLGGIAIIGASLFMIQRNEKVYEFRIGILNHMMINANITREDINKYEKCSYTKMLLMFWKPLDSFYDEEFLQEMRK